MPFADYEDFDACVRDNSDKDEPDAYCAELKRRVEGEESLSENELQALEESDCPNGHVKINEQCVPVEEVEGPPPSQLSALPSSYHLARFDPETIERVEEDDNRVRYTNIKILGPGRWRDSNSRETVWYSPEGIQNLEVDPDNSVHILHDSENEVSEAGEIDPESVRHAENGVFVDIVFDTSKSAGVFADENMQATLESGGAKGFGGPSVEIPPDGQVVEFNHTEGLPELKGGKISDLGLVKNPGSKDVHFARQTANAGVALSGGQSYMAPDDENTFMSDVTVQPSALLETFDLEETDLDLEDRELADVPVAELVSLIAEAYGADPADLMDALDPFINGNDDGDGDDGVENQDDSDDDDDDDSDDADDDADNDDGDSADADDDDDDTDIDIDAEQVKALEERISALEDMMDSMLASEELEDAKEELADADSVSELESALEDAEKRLSALEEEPGDRKTLSDNGNVNGDGDEGVGGRISPIEPTNNY